MIPSEKNIKALIKKIQKEVQAKKKVEQPKLDNLVEADRFEPNSASEMFTEMKKLPFND